MSVIASAPGKALLLGEYVVLDGAQALVMAVDRRATAVLARESGSRCRFEMRAPTPRVVDFASGRPGHPTGSALLDAVLGQADFAPPWPAWSASLDSSAFFTGSAKLGLGSSAAALVALAGAAWKAAGRTGSPPLAALIDCHRAFQGGLGSGIDVAAALYGGAVSFSLAPDRSARVGSVRLPKSVGFAGVFAGGAASTPDLVGQYRRWTESGSAHSATLRERLVAVAERGCSAADEDDGPTFVGAIDEYGRCLDELGREMGRDLVTAAHRKIGGLAGEMGLAYKVSGAGGGDVGIACGLDGDALRSFAAKADDQGFHVVPLTVDELGLRVNEEHAE
jgi:phosphomevalonate kinase